MPRPRNYFRRSQTSLSNHEAHEVFRLWLQRLQWRESPNLRCGRRQWRHAPHRWYAPSRAGQAVERLIGNTLEAQGHRAILRDDPNRLPETYDPAFLHADADLAALADGLARNRQGRLCLYGPSGTGKTAYAR
jgi:hypothetical protein